MVKSEFGHETEVRMEVVASPGAEMEPGVEAAVTVIYRFGETASHTEREFVGVLCEAGAGKQQSRHTEMRKHTCNAHLSTLKRCVALARDFINVHLDTQRAKLKLPLNWAFID